VALEAGPLPDEERRSYRRGAGAAELWLTTVGGIGALVLFDRAVEGMSGTGFSLQGTSALPAGRLTFDGRLPELEGLLPSLNQTLTRYRAFRGLALHGVL
jgi:hypothetical protein